MFKELRFFVLSALAAAMAVTAWVDAAHAESEDIIKVRRMGLDLAIDIARGAVKACGDKGYQVSAVVVDRTGNVQVVMRDTLASRFTIEIAERKANGVVLSGVSSSEFRANRQDIRPEMNEVGGILVLDGGLPVEAAGSLIGAVGVSGAPGGDIDEACAAEALSAVEERTMFAD